MKDCFTCINGQAVAYLGDVVQLEMCSLACTSNLHRHVQPSVQENADVSYCQLRRYVTPTYVDYRNCKWHSGVTRVEDNSFGLGLI